MSEVQEWDGKPKVVLTWPELASIYAVVPQWHGAALGPVLPFGQGKRAYVEINSIFRTTRDEARAAMELNIRDACERESMEYDEEQWTLVFLVMLNGC